MQQYTLEEEIQNGQAIQRFLGDDTVKRVLSGMQLEYFEGWKTAETPDKSEKIRAAARALDDLVAALQIVVESGQRATHEAVQLAKPQTY